MERAGRATRTRALHTLKMGLLLALGCSSEGELSGVSAAAARPVPAAGVLPVSAGKPGAGPTLAEEAAAALAAARQAPVTQSAGAPLDLAGATRAAKTGTLFLRAEGSTTLEPGLALETNVAIHVTGLLARVTVEQRFTNPTDTWAEGIYVFPLPDDAAVDRLTMITGDRTIEGVVKEKEEARRTYTKARDAGQRASLVEQHRPNVFTSFVANLEPGGEVTIAIEYQQSVSLERGELSLRFPMALTPRYGEDGGENGGPTAGAAPAPTADAGATAPESASAPSPVRLLVDLAAGFAVESIESPHHEITVVEQPGGLHEIDLASETVPADRDFVLRWRPMPGDTPQVALFTEQYEGAHYALVTLLPPKPVDAALRRDREVVFVLDTSGSMAGASIGQAREALALALERLGPRDRFELLEFSSETRALFGGAREATPANVAEAVERLGKVKAGGGTEMLPALELALKDDAPSGHLRQVVILTDAAIANESAVLASLRDRLGESRVFAVGIGSAPNGYLLRKLAELGRGSFTHVGSPDEIAGRMAKLFRKLESVAATDLQLELPSGLRPDLYPDVLPDLYDGEPLSVAVELDAPLDWIAVRGLQGDALWIQTATRADSEERPGIHVLWARRKIDAWMHRPARTKAEREARKEIVTEVALAHHLTSAHTSLVAVDNVAVRRDHEAIKTKRMVAAAPSGMTMSRFALAQGATPAPLLRVVGVVLLGLGLALGRLRWLR